jgi:hypothetical protein
MYVQLSLDILMWLAAGSDVHTGHDVEALASVVAANYEGAARS